MLISKSSSIARRANRDTDGRALQSLGIRPWRLRGRPARYLHGSSHRYFARARSFPCHARIQDKLLRPMSADTGVVRGEGKTLHVGRQTAIGEGRLLDAKGRLLAHGTTTCHVVREGIS